MYRLAMDIYEHINSQQNISLEELEEIVEQYEEEYLPIASHGTIMQYIINKLNQGN